jgi:hypothetical protein
MKRRSCLKLSKHRALALALNYLLCPVRDRYETSSRWQFGKGYTGLKFTTLYCQACLFIYTGSNPARAGNVLLESPSLVPYILLLPQ